MTRSHEALVEILETRLDELEKLAQSQRPKVKTVEARLDMLKSNLADRQTTIANLQSEISKSESRLESVIGSASLDRLVDDLHWNELFDPNRKNARFVRLLEILGQYRDLPENLSLAREYPADENALDRIIDEGYGNFKKSIARDQVEWLQREGDAPVNSLIGNLPESTVKECRELADLQPDDPAIPPENQSPYRFFTLLLWHYALSLDGDSVLEKIEEPREGNPLELRLFSGKMISQDLATVFFDFLAMKEAIDMPSVRTTLEIGAGYGLTGFFLLNALPEVRHIIVDTPPALYVSQRYLSSQFPDLEIFTSRPFEDYAEVAADLESSQLAFLFPHQLSLLPRKSIDLAVNISTFGEIRPDQVEHSVREIDRTTSGWFYTRQRNDLETPFELPGSWKKHFSREVALQTGYIEALHQIS